MTKEIILQAVYEITGIEPERILHEPNIRHSVATVTFARSLSMNFCYSYKIGTLAEVGQWHGNRKHSTVIRSLITLQNDICTDKVKKRTYFAVLDRIIKIEVTLEEIGDPEYEHQDISIESLSYQIPK